MVTKTSVRHGIDRERIVPNHASTAAPRRSSACAHKRALTSARSSACAHKRAFTSVYLVIAGRFGKVRTSDVSKI
jgi:hypothetical protein